MRKRGIILYLSCLCGFLVVSSVCAQEEDPAVSFRRLRAGLARSRVPAEEIRSNSSALRSMLARGANRDDLANAVAQLYRKGIFGGAMNTSINYMDELIAAGVPSGESAGVVLQGIDRGMAQGFKCGDQALMNEVRRAVREKEQSLDKSKNSE